MANVGIVGLGMMGSMHIGSWGHVEGARIAAICDQDPKRAAGDLSSAWSNLGDSGISQLDMSSIRGTTDLDELLAMDDIDIVDICLPTPFHAEAVVKALAAGKHVLCEKPLARTADEAERIATAAEGAKGLFMPAMCMRFAPAWYWLKQQIEAGTYGKVLAASFFRMAAMPPGWFSNGDWSGGAILDLHVHDTDYVHFLFGMPAAVSSQGYSKTSGRIDHIHTQYFFDGPDAPAIVTAVGGWCMGAGFEFRMRYLVNFENATAVFDMAAEHPLVITRDGKEEAIDIPPADPWQGELEYFHNCVEAGRAPKRVTAADALASIRIVEAEAKSVETGQRVAMA